MTQGWIPPDAGVVLRISTFRMRADRLGLLTGVRRATEPPLGRSVWIGRRLLDDDGAAEVATVSVWDSLSEMERGVGLGEERLTNELRVSVEDRTVELYGCRAFRVWRRDAVPCLLRIFRGALVEGDPDAFDEGAGAEYVGNFERNPSCVSIAAATGGDRRVALATLWTSWDAVAIATHGELSRVLSVRLPRFAVDGSAVHYELVAASIP